MRGKYCKVEKIICLICEKTLFPQEPPTQFPVSLHTAFNFPQVRPILRIFPGASHKPEELLATE